jgi:hypothetical protein
MNKKNVWPAAIAIIYILFLVVALGTVIFSRYQQADLVESDYYRQGLEYQAQVNRLRNTAALTPRQKPRIQLENSEALLIEMPLSAAMSRPAGTIMLYRPADASADRVFQLETSDKGVQRIDISTLARGMWRVKITWRLDGREFYDDQTVIFD